MKWKKAVYKAVYDYRPEGFTIYLSCGPQSETLAIQQFNHSGER